MTETPHWETDGIPTPLPQIESALDEFWRNQAQDGERAVLRSAMSTLILVATGVPRYQRFLQSLPELIRQRPAASSSSGYSRPGKRSRRLSPPTVGSPRRAENSSAASRSPFTVPAR